MKLERVSQQYIELNLNDTLAAARASLDAKPGFMAVVLDDQKKPVSMLSSADLATLAVSGDQLLANIAGQIPPGLVTDVAQTMEEFTQSPEFTMLSSGAQGVIVLDQDQLAGVMIKETIDRYLRDEYKLADKLKDLSDYAALAGSIINNPIIMYCEEFNHRNELDYYNRHNPPQCQENKPHPHPIRKKK